MENELCYSAVLVKNVLLAKGSIKSVNATLAGWIQCIEQHYKINIRVCEVYSKYVNIYIYTYLNYTHT